MYPNLPSEQQQDEPLSRQNYPQEQKRNHQRPTVEGAEEDEVLSPSAQGRASNERQSRPTFSNNSVSLESNRRHSFNLQHSRVMPHPSLRSPSQEHLSSTSPVQEGSSTANASCRGSTDLSGDTHHNNIMYLDSLPRLPLRLTEMTIDGTELREEVLRIIKHIPSFDGLAEHKKKEVIKFIGSFFCPKVCWNLRTTMHMLVSSQGFRYLEREEEPGISNLNFFGQSSTSHNCEVPSDPAKTLNPPSGVGSPEVPKVVQELVHSWRTLRQHEGKNVNASMTMINTMDYEKECFECWSLLLTCYKASRPAVDRQGEDSDDGVSDASSLPDIAKNWLPSIKPSATLVDIVQKFVEALLKRRGGSWGIRRCSDANILKALIAPLLGLGVSPDFRDTSAVDTHIRASKKQRRSLVTRETFDIKWSNTMSRGKSYSILVQALGPGALAVVGRSK
ncbi:MAG: hypothetical protein Q9201_000861 [Fulgogasparrea decipioides]